MFKFIGIYSVFDFYILKLLPNFDPNFDQTSTKLLSNFYQTSTPRCRNFDEVSIKLRPPGVEISKKFRPNFDGVSWGVVGNHDDTFEKLWRNFSNFSLYLWWTFHCTVWEWTFHCTFWETFHWTFWETFHWTFWETFHWTAERLCTGLLIDLTCSCVTFDMNMNIHGYMASHLWLFIP